MRVEFDNNRASLTPKGGVNPRKTGNFSAYGDDECVPGLQPIPSDSRSRSEVKATQLLAPVDRC